LRLTGHGAIGNPENWPDLASRLPLTAVARACGNLTLSFRITVNVRLARAPPVDHRASGRHGPGKQNDQIRVARIVVPIKPASAQNGGYLRAGAGQR